jgi:GNAT superfamily N-acetyltransferase
MRDTVARLVALRLLVVKVEALGAGSRTMPTIIRFATPGDAAEIHRLVTALAAYEREPDAVVSTVDTIHAQLAQPRPPFECLLAETDATIVGFALFFPTYSTWLGKQGLWLEDLFVLETHRRRGIGRALLARVAHLAVARGCGRLEWSVLDWNRPALEFYRRLGAVAQDSWTTHRLTGDALDALAAPR